MVKRKQQKQALASRKKPVAKNANSLRIIAGQWRGRRLNFIDSEGLRPTGDRVRETLFNWLQVDVPGAVCIDLFAGAGALGFEAASRGAAKVVMIEKSRAVAERLRQNVALLDAGHVEIVNGSAIDWMNGSAEAADIVFVDPPFAGDLLEQSLRQMEAACWLKDSTLIYIETAKYQAFTVPAGWQQLKQKNTGQVSVYLYQRSSER
ncbi:Ribosomal RNA small subunit methyltransferase D [Sinobacterium norvegicum]|uniref:Ribosomal RNA small subunit methyltransferase D n=1 Tax=Sinobacterium norvegicum TaxID=1641715 RepID=A0ABM9AIT7_9GAMM|nr:16S rRNA (guanine(966)-N(2))-methyltransferase RsmD [Sinobacterium norvegicum]CAH0992963.1 Ribosomal RNA small subunit methyltransferase D [Sinobacterium norvegicum]